MSDSTPHFTLEEARIGDIQADLLAHRLSCRELVTAYLERIERFDRAGPRLNSIVSVNERALDQAGQLDDRLRAEGALTGPLHGIPVLVKDQVDTEDMPTSYGSEVFAAYRPAADATLVRRLREAGALILAKTTLPDFAMSYFSGSSRSGITRNPYRPDRDPGGSSSGTGAGIAANLGCVGVGEDTGGSIRVPSAQCCLVGLRPTTGLVSRAGLSAMSVLDDTPGPMARTAGDAARLFEVLTGYDPADPRTALCVMGPPAPDGAEREGLAGRRLGVLRSAFGTDARSAPVNDVVNAQLAALEAAGAHLVDPVSIEGLDLSQTNLVWICARADANAFLSSLPEGWGTTVEEIHAAGRYHPQLDLLGEVVQGPADYRDDPRYLACFRAREDLRLAVLQVLARHDLDALVYPSVQIPAPRFEEIDAGTWTTSNFPVNSSLAPHGTFPAITVPAGFTADGCPVGLEFLGPAFSDRRLLRLAQEVETAAPHRRPPNLAR